MLQKIRAFFFNESVGHNIVIRQDILTVISLRYKVSSVSRRCYLQLSTVYSPEWFRGSSAIPVYDDSEPGSG